MAPDPAPPVPTPVPTPVTTPVGHVVRDALGLHLRFRRHVPRPVAAVWAGLTDNAVLARWYGRWEGDPASGRVLVHLSEEGDAPPEALDVRRCAPPHHLAVTASPGGEDPWPLEVDLAPDPADPGATLLTFVHHLSPGLAPGDVGAGWHWYLDRLGAVLEDRPPPGDWDEYAGLADRYPAP
ncbi:SRPBCC domain-containing protein [Cellulomonas endophytica]|uniref:SRPBCC domain-containing protein n=1 Tax=Cellulomonas endophytica TaxID=2494735 RepID=UPI0013E99C86|nr:SRPBCC domain-containing protein [Cellulomonas endophytica]